MNRHRVLNLKAGESVEVRSRREILATLDEHGCLEGLPFMPEMLPYCGQKLRVFKRADKTCDPAHDPWSIRRLHNSVHLEKIRCGGEGHGGCEAGCLIFWKEAWLKRADSSVVPAENLRPRAAAATENGGLCTLESILAASHRNVGGESLYSCQATELRNYTSPMAWWDPRPYIRDLRSGNLASGIAGSSKSEGILELGLGMLVLLRGLVVGCYNAVQTRRRGIRYPQVDGQLKRTPVATLDLQDGELVEVLSKDDILATLDEANRNRGLSFDVEMVHYCGGIYRVLRRVSRIVDERTGKIVNMKYPCIVLEGVVCRSDYHRSCPRAIYHYWRENWLKRAAVPVLPAAQIVESCEGVEVCQ